MPPAEEVLSKKQLLARFLGYGEEKTKKTWWFYSAAALGYNVIHLCLEDSGMNILQAVPKEWLKYITVIDARNTFDRPAAADFMNTFFRGQPFLWDEQERNFVYGEHMLNSSHSHYYINPNLLTPNDFLGLDSWTSLAPSLAWRYCIKHSLAFDEAEEQEGKELQAHYKWCGNVLDWMLAAKDGLNCHFVTLGHMIAYEKIKQKGKIREVLWTREQPVSSSGPHGMKTANKFSDILFFYMRSRNNYAISTEKIRDRVGGTRLIPPGDYAWEDLLIPNIVNMTGLAKPNGQELKAFQYFPAGSEISFDELGLRKGGAFRKIAATKEGEIKKTGSLAGLMKAKTTETAA